jgi:methylase of polypeptide subunit release factors
VLSSAERTLHDCGAAAPAESALELLSVLLRVSRPVLLAHLTSPIAPAVAAVYETWISRYAAGEALANITGHLEFMGLDISVGESSPPVHLIARQVVETALHWVRRRAPEELSAAEIDTGCGAIALALAALEPSFTRIYATDRSATALETAQANGARYLLNLVVIWREGEGLSAVPDPVDLIICGQPGWMDFELIPAKLRPDGVVICALPTSETAMATELLTRYFATLPFELSWIENQSDGYAIAVASRRPDADEDM